MKAKIEEMGNTSKIKNVRDLYRGINNLKKGYQPRSNIEKDEQGDLVVDSHSILTRWRNYFSQILNVHGFNGVRQAEIHTAELLVPEPSVSKIELAIDKIRSHKSLGIDQIPAELIKAGGRTIHSEIHKLITSIWNNKELPEECKQSIKVLIYKKGNKTDCNNYRGISLFPSSYKILFNILLSRLIPYAEEISGDRQCGLRRNKSTTDHMFCIRQILQKKWEYKEAVHQIYIDCKKAYDSVRGMAVSTILTEFSIPRKLLRLI
jgi:hypothetical protein